MMRTSNVIWVALSAALLVASPIMAGFAQAGLRVSFAYTSAPADVRVWLDGGYDHYDDYYEESGYDVYASADDVVLCVQTSRSSYVTVYVVDTDGYIHVVHPLSARDSVFLRGGRVYRFHLSEYGFYGFDSGIAYAFAVSSPTPFHYDVYSLDIFGCGYGYRIYGDPYVASKRFYVSLVTGTCEPSLLGVSYARFYVREYVRYPRYLCLGWHDHYGVRHYCRGDCEVYRHYRLHAADPFSVLHPKVRLAQDVDRLTKVARHEGSPVRFKGSDGRGAAGATQKIRAKDAAQLQRQTKTVVRESSQRRTHVIRSSKDTWVKSRDRISTMRRALEEAKGQEKVTARAPEKRVSKTRVQQRPGRDVQASVAAKTGKVERSKATKSSSRKTHPEKKSSEAKSRVRGEGK